MRFFNMLGAHVFSIVAQTSAATAPAVAESMPAGHRIAPLVVLFLCVFSGLGTFLLLPSRRDVSFRRLGGAMALAGALIFFAMVGAGGGRTGVYFWIFAAVAILGAVRVITHSRPVYSALYFVLTVFASAGLFVLLSAEFMAAALVLIYAGAILITYVFVIMLAAQASTARPADLLNEFDVVSREPFLASVVGFALMGVLLFVIFDRAEGIAPHPPMPEAREIEQIEGQTQRLGVYLFQHQAANLELSGLILTVSMVGAIVIARKRVVYHEGHGPGSSGMVVAPATPIDDNPFSIPVYGTDNPRQKEYPET